MPDLDIDTARIVARLVELQARVAELNTEAEALKAELRNLGEGEYRIDGKPAVKIIPNRRFDVNAAAMALAEDTRLTCLKVEYDPSVVKRHLTPEQVDSFMREVGKPKVAVL